MRVVYKLVETFHGQGLPVLKTTNFGSRKETWNDRRQRESENYMTLVFNNKRSAIINRMDFREY